jgi:hypothetical protein
VTGGSQNCVIATTTQWQTTPARLEREEVADEVGTKWRDEVAKWPDELGGTATKWCDEVAEGRRSGGGATKWRRCDEVAEVRRSGGGATKWRRGDEVDEAAGEVRSGGGKEMTLLSCRCVTNGIAHVSTRGSIC